MEDTLIRIGLRPKSARLYVKMLQLGSSTITQIARATGFKRSSTYLLVEELLIRGFMRVTKKGKRNYYAPEPPERLVHVFKSRERELEQLLPELEALYREPTAKPRIQSYEGPEVMVQIYDEMYDVWGRKQEALFFADISQLAGYFSHSLTSYYRRLRDRPAGYRLRELLIDNAQGRAHREKVKSMGMGKNHHMRLLDPRKFSFPKTDNLIFGDKIVMFSLTGEIFTVIVEHRNIAETYRSLFEAAWSVARE